MGLDSLLLSSGIFNSLFRSGGIENVGVDNNGYAVKVYSDLVNNNLSVGFQPSETSHDDYKELGIIDFGSLYPEDFNK